jgi:hypothetical protein
MERREARARKMGEEEGRRREEERDELVRFNCTTTLSK